MMQSEMKTRSRWAWVLGLALGVLAPLPHALAQDEPAEQKEIETGSESDVGSETGPGGEAGPVVDAGIEEPPAEAASDAMRVVRIRKVITLDKQRLGWLRSELRSRARWFEALAEGMGEIAQERNEKREELEALEASPEADPEEAAARRAEIEELDEDHALFDTQTDLALSAEKTIHEQIEALEEKIEKDEHALGRLTGEIAIELPEEAPAAEPTGPAAPAEAAKRVLAPLPVPGPDAAPAPKPTKTSSAMTAAQLAAQRKLERAEREVEIAKLDLSEFVERKRALQHQIEFEEELAESDTKERENLERAFEAFAARLKKYRETDAARNKIERLERANRGITDRVEELQKTGGARAEYIKSLEERLANLEEAELRVTAEVDEKQGEAVKVRRSVMWLESPIHPRNIADWAKERGPRILMVIAAAFFLLLFVRLSARRIARTFVVRRHRGDRGGGTGRADTLAFSFQSVLKVLIVLFGVLLVLQEAGVDIKTLLGGAAIIGVAIAFGAQDLMKDYFSGFLILLEDQYQLGDLVTIKGITGTVESVNMRVTVLRDLEGRVHFVPNGNIDQVTNRTYGWGRPVFEVPVGFDEDVDKVMETLVDVAKKLSEDPGWKGSIIGEPDMLGVDKFTDYGAVIKFMVKTQPDKLFVVRREMLRRVSKRFIEDGIRITVPQRILVRDDDDAPG
jgi:small conductance mechanosensitive channel